MRKERFTPESGAEKGRNVQIILKFIRHGERTKTGELTDYGREITRQRAQESGIQKEDFDAIKAVGSQAGPNVLVPIEGGFTSSNPSQKMGRSLETAHIYGKEIASDAIFQSRPRNILSYETLVNSVPFDYNSIYNSSLPVNFENLSPEEKIIASKKGQIAVTNYLMSLHTPEAGAFKKEVAGAFASFILHNEELAKRLDAGSKVLMPAGTHGGLIEPFLQLALVRKMEDGRKIHGFKRLEEIGGDFDPSEAFDVEIIYDENGDIKPLRVKWDNPQRPQAQEMHLDPIKLRELADFYKELHPKEGIE